MCVVVVQGFVAAQRVDGEGVNGAEELSNAQLLFWLHEMFHHSVNNRLTKFILQSHEVDNDVIFALLLAQFSVHRLDHPLDVARTHADRNVVTFEFLLQDRAELLDDVTKDVESHIC